MADTQLHQDLRLKKAEEALSGLQPDEMDAVLAHRGFYRYLTEDTHDPSCHNESGALAVTDSHPEMICHWTPDGQINFANEAYCHFFGLTVIGPDSCQSLPQVHHGDAPLVAQTLAALGPDRPFADLEYRVKVGQTFLWTQWTHQAHFSSTKELEQVQSIARNISRRKHNEALLRKLNIDLEQSVAERTAELAAKNRELETLNRTIQSLSRRTQEAIENDRRNIFRDLHDSIGASLAAIKFGLEQRVADIENGLDNSDISFEDLITQIKATIKETKRISQGLRPSTLDELGLRITMESHIKALAEIHPDINFNSQLELPEEKIPDTIQIVLYRVLQEALNNICRHSNADNVFVCLTSSDENLLFEISDDGHGFVLSDNRISEEAITGYGLQSMRDRVAVSGGEFLIESNPNQGTRIQVRFPTLAGQ